MQTNAMGTFNILNGEDRRVVGEFTKQMLLRRTGAMLQVLYGRKCCVSRIELLRTSSLNFYLFFLLHLPSDRCNCTRSISQL